MSAPNFQKQHDFPLIVVMGEDDWEQFEWDYAYDYHLEVCYTFNKKLKYHTVEMKSGYYQGMQYYVYIKPDANTMTKAFAAEQERISKFLRKIWLNHNDVVRLNLDGIFSNGEAIYSLIPKPSKKAKGAK